MLIQNWKGPAAIGSPSHTGVRDEHGNCAESLAQQQIFVVSHAVGRPIRPGRVPVAGPGFETADRRLPAPGGLAVIALDVCSARETEESRLQVFELLQEIGPKQIAPR